MARERTSLRVGPRFTFPEVIALPLLFLLPAATAAQQSLLSQQNLLSQMAANEIAARSQNILFAYTSEERSTRTGGQLWRERVVETPDGVVRRLIARDGKPLTAEEANAEERRLAQIAADPAAFRKQNQERRDAEAHAIRLLQLLPKAFLLSPAGVQNGCTRIAFKPDPRFTPSSYEERVIHALAGTVAIKEPMDRLCSVHGTISTPVEFGFGLLGRLDQGGELGLERIQVDAHTWKTDRILIHIVGQVFLLKSLVREQEVVRTDIRVLNLTPSLTQAIQLTRP